MIVVVGGGVVGCAVAAALLEHGMGGPRGGARKVLLAEQGPSLVAGSSSGNSGICHTGFDAPLGSVEGKCMKRSRVLMKELLQRFESEPFVLQEVGALLVAWTEQERQQLAGVLEKARANGVAVELLSREQALQEEPGLNQEEEDGRRVVAAVRISEEAIVDPLLLPLTMAQLASHRGCEIRCGWQLVAAEEVDGGNAHWRLDFRTAAVAPERPEIVTVHADFVVNCAGLFGDEVERILFPRRVPPFIVVPRKGQFLVYEEKSGQYLRRIILPVPTERTKGVLAFPSVYGHVVVGPTAEDQLSRDAASTDATVGRELQQKGEQLVPALRGCAVVGSYAGLRPATEHRDYQLRVEAKSAYACAGGVRSTGLTACLGIAEHLCELLETHLTDRMRETLTISAQEHVLRESAARRRDRTLQWRCSEDGHAVTANDSQWYQAMHRLGQQCKSKL